MEKIDGEGVKMSLCGICYDKIEDGLPMDEEHLGYDHCEDENTIGDYLNR